MSGRTPRAKRTPHSAIRPGLAAALTIALAAGMVGATTGASQAASPAHTAAVAPHTHATEEAPHDHTAAEAAPHDHSSTEALAVVSAAAVAPATITWLQRASAAIARAEAGGVAVGGKLYVFGGQFSGVTQTLRSDRYDPATNSWTRLRDLPELITHAPVVADGTTLWILGGYVGLDKKDSSRRVWKYDIPTDTYTAGPALPAARGGGGAAIVGRQLHYLTGAVRQDSTGASTVDHPDHWVLNLDGGTTWTASTPVPNPRNHVGTVVLGSKIYVIGGQHRENESGTPQVQVDAFDVVTKTWTRRADLPVARGHISASTFAWNGKVLVLGGSEAGAVSSRTLYEYDPATNAWITRTSLPEALKSPVADLIDGKIIVSGGRTASGATTKTWSGSTTATTSPSPSPSPTSGTAGGWSTGPALPIDLLDAGGAAIGTKIYVVDGKTSTGPKSSLRIFDTATSAWTTGAGLPGSAVENPAVVAHNGKLYAFGGSTGPFSGASRSLYRYDPATNAWTARASMATGRGGVAGVVVGGRIWAIGGMDSTGASLKTTEKYDIATNTWSAGPSLLTARDNPGAAVVNDRIHVFGGRTRLASGTEVNPNLASAEMLNPLSGGWLSRAPMPTGRRTMAVGVVNGRVIAAGGEKQPSGATWPQTQEYDPATNTWRSLPNMITPRHGAVGAVVSGRLHVIAGGPRGGSSYSRVHEILTPTSASSPSPATPPPTPTPSGATSVKVRFATATATPPTGYLADWGQPYGARTSAGQGSGRSYGWVRDGSSTAVDFTLNSRLRTGTPTSDTRLTGLMHMDWRGGTSGTTGAGSWEMAVPNGLYSVTISVGDAGNYFDSVDQVSIENQNAVARFVPSDEDRFRTAVRTVQVSDGRLTLSPRGGTNTKINFVEVEPVPASPDRPQVASVTPVNLTTGATRDISVTAGLAVTAGGIATSTLTRETVRLSVAADGSSVPANVNTSGGGDVIVLTPDAPLVAGTTYRFDVTSAVRDVSGNAFHPWSSVFTVGTASEGTGITGVAFDQVATTATGQGFTSVAMGPDGKLYAATLDGYLFRYPVAADGSLGTGERIDTIRTLAGGARTVIGLAFDPAATAANPILWVTENRKYVGVSDVPDWTGKIVRLSGAALQNGQDVVVGLPRSARDHESNSLAFKDGMLYLTQGSNTAMGAPDSAWEYRPESKLSAAVLRLDPAKLPATLPLNVKTAEGGTYDPSAPGAALTLYATGVRNAYDLIWHSNGRLYVPTNGSARGGAFPATPATLPSSCTSRIDGPWTGPRAPGVGSNPVDETDWVFKATQGGYYGHPNPSRCEWVFNGGNPTSAQDAFEATAYPVGVLPDRNYRKADVFDAGLHASANGVIEYLGGGFGGALKGKLIVVRYSASQDLMVLDPSGTDGRIVSRTLGVAGFKGFDQPLDVAQHAASGSIYVTELGGRKITRLVPRG
ncbi:hypothetical protein C1I63_05840 [Rathayibacter caricis DSM 15933]|uniref:SbsA Ig-like domain-containing protein n=1 Tax=Rathayibacter caricis DSM 15933 TaxID=1328867 RepID=A0A2T4USD6_9MICO|nr:kelch repeat-containing protein [Rathayibacter caricis]PTL72416.1 hypothetical protein C1I63_05840 [Rathayibacter caricis DSM 15933]